MDQNLAIPERYDIYQQDLTVPYIKLTKLGHVRTIDEARTMCAAFNQQDHQAVVDGRHTYIFICSQMKGENNHEF